MRETETQVIWLSSVWTARHSRSTWRHLVSTWVRWRFDRVAGPRGDRLQRVSLDRLLLSRKCIFSCCVFFFFFVKKGRKSHLLRSSSLTNVTSKRDLLARVCVLSLRDCFVHMSFLQEPIDRAKQTVPLNEAAKLQRQTKNPRLRLVLLNGDSAKCQIETC